MGGLTPQCGWQIQVSPNQLCWELGVIGQEGKPSKALCKGAELHPPCPGAGEGGNGVNIPSTEGNSHRSWLMPAFYFVYEAKRNQIPCAADCSRHFLSSIVTFSEGYSKIRK